MLTLSEQYMPRLHLGVVGLGLSWFMRQEYSAALIFWGCLQGHKFLCCRRCFCCCCCCCCCVLQVGHLIDCTR